VRKIATDGDRLRREAIGELEVEDGVLVIRRIRMQVRCGAEESAGGDSGTDDRGLRERMPRLPFALQSHHITTELDFQPI